MNTVKPNRIGSIDLLRGVIMIIMALDHTRYYFHTDVYFFNPLDLEKTNIPLFFTRWITHLCAPIFVLLAGTSAYISGQRKTTKQLALFLVKRGLWLIFLEITFVNFSWFFDIHFSFIQLGAIWSLGISMICLAGLIFLPEKWILVIGLLLVSTNYRVDQIHNLTNPSSGGISALLHNLKTFSAGDLLKFFHGNQLTPYIGVMAFGYCLGQIFSKDFNVLKRRRILLILGSVSWILFVTFRIINGYFYYAPQTILPTAAGRILYFLNFSKYPPSLDYILFTIGFAFLFLAFTENITNRFTKIISVYGRVPLFYYLIHIYFIHLLAMVAAVASGHPWSDMIIRNIWISESPNLKGYGFNLFIVYLIWIFVVAALYPLCRMYDRYKSAHKDKWWLSYM